MAQVVKTRIKQKHELATDWASATAFKPLAGELIVYDADDTQGPRLKIGDEETPINDLPFVEAVPTGIYGVCETAAGTAAKTVDIPHFNLKVGAMIVVKFVNENSVASPTLNVNETGAIPMYQYGTTAMSTGTTTNGWRAGAVLTLIYDGTGWVKDYWNNSTYSNVALGQGYATCSTAASTAAKVASSSNYKLSTGGIVVVKFTHDVPANATLNINSQGAKAIYFGANKITAGVIKAGDTAVFMYSSYYRLISIDRWQNDISTHTVDTVVHITADERTQWNAAEQNVQSDWDVTDTASDAYIKNKPTIPVDTNTTYDLAAPASKTNGNVTIDLTAGGSGSETDSIIIKGSGATTVTTDANGVITISSTDTNTQDGNDNQTIKAKGVSFEANDVVELEEGSNVVITADKANKTITISATDTTYSVATKDNAGLMSAADKSNLDTIVSHFNDDDADTTIDTVKEVLKAFENAPEGTDIANALAGKSNVGHTHEVTTQNAAPHTHTHSVTVSGTTGANSGSAVTVATGSVSSTGGGATVATGASGTTTVLKGVKASGTDTFLKSINAGSGSLTSDTNATNGIKYVEAISSTAASATGTAEAGSEDHTHTLDYTKPTGVSLGSNTTSTNGVKYLEDVSHTAASLTGTKTFNIDAIKSVTLTPSDTSTDGPVYVQSISGSAPSLGGTTTFVTSVTTGSGSLTAYDAASGGNQKVANGTRIPVITSLSKVGYTPAGSVTLTNGTAPSMNFNTGTSTDTPYIASLSKSGYTPAGSVTLTDGTAPSMGNATTKYLSASASGTAVGADGTANVAPSGHTHSITVSGTTGANSGTAVKAVTGYSSFSGGSLGGTKTFNTDAIKSIGGTKNYGFSSSTSDIMHSPTVTDGVLSWSTTSAATQDAHTGTAASTGTVTFTAASLGTASTADVAPAAHTHGYGSSTALTTGANSGTAITALTGVKVTAQPTITLTANTSTATGRIKYVEDRGTFSAGTTPKASASFTGTNSTAVVTDGTTKYMKFSAGTTPKASASFSGTNSTAVVTGGTTYYLNHAHTSAQSGGNGTVTISGGSYTPTSKYMKATCTAASTGTVGISGGSVTKTTKYFHPTITTETATATTGAPSATTTFVTGVTGGTATATTKYLHHTHTGASGNDTGTAVTAVAADGTTTAVTGISTSKLVTTTAAPNSHTHSYGSSTALTTGNNSGDAVAAVTAVSASTN